MAYIKSKGAVLQERNISGDGEQSALKERLVFNCLGMGVEFGDGASHEHSGGAATTKNRWPTLLRLIPVNGFPVVS